jgi:peptidoglycan/LPS O-acetylase OafA/YrhL
MLFYLVFALSVAAPRRAAVSIVTLVLISAVWVGKHLGSLPTVFDYWSNDIILEFVLGMLLGLAYQEGIRLARPIRMLLVGGGLLLLYIAFTHPDFPTSYRSANWGVPAAMIVAGSVFGAPIGPSAGWRWLGAIGDASYALYLIHSLPIRGLRLIWTWFGMGIRDTPWVYLFCAVATATVAALVVHFCIERPMGRWCRAIISSRSSKGVSLSRTSVAG